MITPQEIRKQATAWYKNFLVAWLQMEELPLEIRFGKVKSSSILEDFATLSMEIQQLKKASKDELGFGYSIEFKETDTRKAGRQWLPGRIYFETPEDYLKFLKKEKEFQAFIQAVATIRFEIPELELWLLNNPLKIIENAGKWDDLLKVCHYFIANPVPELYIRELPVKVHTKFIEDNTSVLTSLLDFLISAHVSPDEKEFRKRYNLKYDEPLLRIRVLDEEMALAYFSGINDMSIPLAQFNTLDINCEKVFILENKTNFSNIFNFLTIPHLTKSVAVFGEGFKLRLLKNTPWLQDKEIYYWGDIDAHGFEMLSILRGYFPQTKSFLMDFKTFNSFKKYAVKGTDFYRSSLSNLTEDENYLFYHLLQLEDKNRLEQEKINQDFVVKSISNL